MSKNSFPKYLHVFKTMYELFFNEESNEMKMFQISYIYMYICDGSHKNVQFNVPVGHLMISLYF